MKNSRRPFTLPDHCHIFLSNVWSSFRLPSPSCLNEKGYPWFANFFAWEVEVLILLIGRLIDSCKLTVWIDKLVDFQFSKNWNQSSQKHVQNGRAWSHKLTYGYFSLLAMFHLLLSKLFLRWVLMCFTF